MAGESSRFTQAGYELPKYMLPLWGDTVFDYVMKSFKRYFVSDFFIFAVREEDEYISFVKQHAQSLGILDYRVVPIVGLTKGQAHTAYIALDSLAGFDSENLLIFNIDTLRPEFKFPNSLNYAGWLETFIATGDHWSFVLPTQGAFDQVEQVAEKVRISDLCCTGAYWFYSAQLFKEIYLESTLEPSSLKEEFVSPLYNILIRSGGRVFHSLTHATDVLACGTPSEYEYLRNAPSLKRRFEA
jgi:dTDP-glucose pyrophosphorylase